MNNSLIILMAGSGTRCNLGYNKALYKIDGKPLFVYSLEKFYKIGFKEIFLVVSNNDLEEVKDYLEGSIYNSYCKLIIGGSERYLSVKNALKEVSGDKVFIHDAARPLISEKDLDTLIKDSNKYLCGTMYHPCLDTARFVDKKVTTIDRNKLHLISTPQYFDKSLFDIILNNNTLITDEISLFENIYDIGFTKETSNNLKVTLEEDLDYVSFILRGNKNYFIGHSLDYHPFSNKDKPLILGGVVFNDYKILEGHSDADVVYHAVTEAIMGACNLGDLGTLFPDNDIKYKDIDSSLLLKEVMNIINKMNFEIQNIDVMVYLINPKLKDKRVEMANNISVITKCNHVCIKAATLNKKGLISLEEGIGAEATVLVNRK